MPAWLQVLLYIGSAAARGVGVMWVIIKLTWE
jgi:hypothetical protein